MQQNPTQEQVEEICGKENPALTDAMIEQIKKEAAEGRERPEEKQRRYEEWRREKRAQERNYQRMVL